MKYRTTSPRPSGTVDRHHELERELGGAAAQPAVERGQRHAMVRPPLSRSQ